MIRGPGSVLYGSDALGGVLRIEPAEAPILSKGEWALICLTHNVLKMHRLLTA